MRWRCRSPKKNHFERGLPGFDPVPARPCASENNGNPVRTGEDAGRFPFERAVDEIPLTYCWQCDACIAVSATATLSTHPTSAGVVVYFRCTAGHCGFYA